jgi:hypothetical protein
LGEIPGSVAASLCGAVTEQYIHFRAALMIALAGGAGARQFMLSRAGCFTS